MTDDKAFKKVTHAGRPSECSREIIKKIRQAILTGAYVETAAAFVGVSKKTLYSWMSRGNKEPDSIFGEFLNAVDQAFAEYELRELNNIDKAAMGHETEFARYPEGTEILDRFGNRIKVGGMIMTNDKGNPIISKVGASRNWAASAWRLERKFPDKWSSIQKVENTNGPQVIVHIPSNGREVDAPIDLNNEVENPTIEDLDSGQILIDIPSNGKE